VAPERGFIEPRLPSPADKPPSGSNWIHEIKHDGKRAIAPLGQPSDRDIRLPGYQVLRITAQQSRNDRQLALNGKNASGHSRRRPNGRLRQLWESVPAVYPYRYYVAGGGLSSYGPNLPSLFRQAAGYVDRILKGEKPASLPVQAPTKYELVVKTAKALGLEVPPSLSPAPTR
jgi:hypothetical protein